MNINIEVVDSKAELEFPYVAKTDFGTKVLVINGTQSLVLEVKNPSSKYSVNQLVHTYNLVIVKRYKIIDFNLKLKEV